MTCFWSLLPGFERSLDDDPQSFVDILDAKTHPAFIMHFGSIFKGIVLFIAFFSASLGQGLYRSKLLLHRSLLLRRALLGRSILKTRCPRILQHRTVGCFGV